MLKAVSASNEVENKWKTETLRDSKEDFDNVFSLDKQVSPSFQCKLELKVGNPRSPLFVST